MTLLPGEPRENFDELVNQHIRRFAPVDDVEFGMIEEMTNTYWRQRRAWNIETLMFQDALAQQPPGDEGRRLLAAFRNLAAGPEFALLHRYEARLHLQHRRALHNLLVLKSQENEPDPGSEDPVEPQPLPPSTAEATMPPVVCEETPASSADAQMEKNPEYQTNLVPFSDSTQRQCIHDASPPSPTPDPLPVDAAAPDAQAAGRGDLAAAENLSVASTQAGGRPIPPSGPQRCAPGPPPTPPTLYIGKDLLQRGSVKSKIIILSMALLLAAWGQTVRSSITGAITDAARKPLTGVSVRLTQQETGKQRIATTDSEGEFVVSLLAPGTYRLEAERDGYRKHIQDVTLRLNQELRIEIPLLAGARTESIQVTAARGVLRTESAAVGSVIGNRQITGLPLDGRNFFELSLLAPGVVPPAPGSAGSVRGDFAININGAREDANNFLLDGIYNGDPKLNAIAVNPPVDAVREFEVLASSYDASFGRNAGGQLSVVLKSGTNQLHGAAYEFFRNGALDARNFFAPGGASPQYQRNQFGFSAGAPLVRNRTFVFGDYEGRRVREAITRVSNVPTALERIGDFSRSQAPAIDPFAQRPFPGNLIPKERIHPVGAAIAALYPLPDRAVPGQNFVSSPTLRDRDDHMDVRLDHVMSPSSELAVRYSFAGRSLFDPFSGAGFATVPGFGTDVPRRAQNVMASETHIFTPNLINELRLGFNRVAAGSFHQNQGRSINRAVGLPELSSNARDFGLSFITVTGYSPLGDEYNNPQHSVSNIYEVIDHATWARGRHLVRFGGDFRKLQQNAYRDVQSRGFLNFLGLSGNSLAELLMGFPSVTGGAHLDNHQHLRMHSEYGFLQDTWRARPDLTLSLGVRYEFNAPPVDAADRANVFDVATRSLVHVGTGGVPRSGYTADRNNWAPRVGIAWSPGRRATVLRAGYGVYYDQGALATGEGLYFNAPYFDFKLFFPLLDFGLPLTLSDPFPRSFPLALPSSALAFQRDLRTAYTQQWSFNVQREIGRDHVIEVGYVGSKGTKLLGGRDRNQPRPSPRQPNPRPLPQFDDITILESRARSSYHSLQARFEQNFAHGLTALASYTWSKSLDDASSFFSSAGDPNYPQDSNNVRAERGLSNFDVRHRFSLSYSYDLPLGKGPLRGGWQTFGIWTFQTGRPFTVALLPDFDNSNTGRSTLGFGANDRPNVLRRASLEHPSLDRWFDTGAFAVPPFGNFGNAGRNILTGPGYQNINVSIVKNTRLGETLTLQFRAEAFNLLNHANFDLPDIFVGSPTFGRIQSAESPRHVQFGLKFLF